MGDLTRVSVVPELIAALVTTAQDTFDDPGVWDGDDVAVYDGLGTSEDPGCYLMVGVDDPDGQETARSAESQQEWAHANGRARNEEGDVSCVVYTTSGSSGSDAQRNVREKAYRIAAQVAEMCRTDQALGVDGLLWTSYGTNTLLTQITDEDGVLALLMFRIHFKARI